MFIKFLIIFSFVLSTAFALEPGTCRAIPESKVYLSDHFSLPYPKDVEFTCLYECLGTNEDVSHEVLGTWKVRIRNQNDDALKVVCQGVKVKRTSWGYDFDRVVPFYAYMTKIAELRKWANGHVSKDNPFERKNLKELKRKLHDVVRGYEQASHSGASTADSFSKASNLLDSISRGLPEDAEILDYSIDAVRSGEHLINDDHLANRLASQVLKSLAYWR